MASDPPVIGSSTDWSSHARKYNKPDGQALSMPMVRVAFEQRFFPALDAKLNDRRTAQQQPLKILCLCGGTGPETELLCERYTGEQVDVLTTDNAQGMVDVAQEMIDRRGWGQRASARVMDAMQIDAADQSFDVIFLVLGPMLLPDASKCFRDVARVLQPDGLFFTLTPGPMEIHAIMADKKKNFLEHAGRGQTYRNLFLERIVETWGTPDALKSKLSNAECFANVEAAKDASILSVPDEQDVHDLLDSLFANPGMAMMYTNDLAEDEADAWKKEVRESMLQACRAARSNAGHDSYELDMSANAAWASGPKPIRAVA